MSNRNNSLENLCFVTSFDKIFDALCAFLNVVKVIPRNQHKREKCVPYSEKLMLKFICLLTHDMDDKAAKTYALPLSHDKLIPC